jgi:hypothetical protein
VEAKIAADRYRGIMSEEDKKQVIVIEFHENGSADANISFPGDVTSNQIWAIAKQLEFLAHQFNYEQRMRELAKVAEQASVDQKIMTPDMARAKLKNDPRVN